MKTSFAGIALAGLAALVASPLHAQSGSTAVNTQTSLYLAGGNAYTTPIAGGQPGIAPAAISLTAGTGRTLLVSASGSAAYCGPGVCVAPTPDGPAIAGTALNASGAISGISAPTSGFLAGVFLGAGLPAVAPASLNFNALTTNFAFVTPTLGQLFFIGDGFATGAVQQQFVVPDAATRLYFGIADGGAFIGDPGFYADNVGSYQVNYRVTASVVPEPATWTLLATGLALVGAVARRRRASR